MSGKGAATVASRAKMSDIGDERHRREGRQWRRRRFSIPWSDRGALEEEEQRKKKEWGVKM
jgi:hypothetical protein